MSQVTAPSPQHLLSLSGNTAGTLQLLSSGTVYLAGGPNITLSQNQNSISFSGGAGGAGITNINVSAGTTSNNLSALTFADSNGVTFGLDGSTLTASVAPGGGGLTNIRVSGGTTSNLLSAITFADSNGISFGLNASTMTATVKTDYQTAGAYLTTAMLSNAATISNLRVSAGTTSNLLSAITFADSNGLAFGINASTVTGSYTVPTVTNSSWTVSDAGTSGTVGRLAFTNLNNLTLSLSSGAAGLHTIVGSFSVTNTIPPIGTAVKVVQTSGSTGTITRFAPEDHAHQGIAGVDAQGIASTFFGTHQFSAGNEMSIATGGGTSRGTFQFINLHSSATTVSSVATANAIGANASRYALEGHEHGGVPTVSAVGNTTGNTTQGNLSLILAGGPNITLSGATAAGAMTLSVSAAAPGGGATLSWFEYPSDPFVNTQSHQVVGSTQYVFPFILPQAISASYIRFLASWALTSTSFATSAVPWNTVFSQINTAFAVVYSQNVGASSRSLASVASGSAGWTYQVSATGANATNNWTVTQNLTWGAEGGQGNSNAASNYASTLSTVNVSTTGLTNFTNYHYLDIPFATSLSPGNYWMALGYSTTTGGGKGLAWGVSSLAISQANTTIANLGAATNSTWQFQPGIGSWSTNAINTTASIGLASISSSASQNRPYFQMIRQA